MAVTCIALSDAAIKRAVADQSITEIRDPRFPLRLRLASSRSRGSWHLITYKDGKANWAKVADWPLVSAKAMLDDLPSLSMQHRQDQSVKFNTWLSCGGLLVTNRYQFIVEAQTQYQVRHHQALNPCAG